MTSGTSHLSRGRYINGVDRIPISATTSCLRRLPPPHASPCLLELIFGSTVSFPLDPRFSSRLRRRITRAHRSRKSGRRRELAFGELGPPRDQPPALLDVRHSQLTVGPNGAPNNHL